MLVPRMTRHLDRIHSAEEEIRMLRSDIENQSGRVQELEKGRDIDELRILHAYDHLKEAHSQIQMQHLLMEDMDLCTKILEERVALFDERDYSSFMMVDFLYQQLLHTITHLVVYFGFW